MHTVFGSSSLFHINLLEETAFLMDSPVSCEKPIVASGAMRPYTSSSSMVIQTSSMLSCSLPTQSRGNRGLVVAFNSRIIPGYWATKLHSKHPNAFGTTATGDQGLFINNLTIFYNTPSQPLFKRFFNIAVVSTHPSYPALHNVFNILYAARQLDGRLWLNAQGNGAAGVIIAGTGNGGLPTGEEDIAEALESDQQIVLGTRRPFGPSHPERSPAYAKSGFVHVIQARIMLQLVIASGYDMK
ncbi:Asparaginase/glutaminase [Plenodomus tracheiphilus IPT5]|uniref:asparaginase n=1 Tax=Plenodomus tracheiphilus IPT5 TaxID=1408161 RepID=A0A6A7AP29_9PLEO|nr:Asparaginase/glutaminase [Plenodomus tracheiphilus IPT5]